jgi:hypothetical protein
MSSLQGHNDNWGERRDGLVICTGHMMTTEFLLPSGTMWKTDSRTLETHPDSIQDVAVSYGPLCALCTVRPKCSSAVGVKGEPVLEYTHTALRGWAMRVGGRRWRCRSGMATRTAAALEDVQEGEVAPHLENIVAVGAMSGMQIICNVTSTLFSSCDKSSERFAEGSNGLKHTPNLPDVAITCQYQTNPSVPFVRTLA